MIYQSLIAKIHVKFEQQKKQLKIAKLGIFSIQAARLRGIPAELLIFPDENHWVLKPQNGILWQRTFFNWLDRWLKK